MSELHDESAEQRSASAPDAALPPGPVVVGIGASAGGLAALKRFFATVPADTGLAFVVVVHLAPEHESFLANLVQPYSAIPLVQVNEDARIEPNYAYVIPPGRNLTAVDSHLRLAPLAPSRAGRAPIDHFFRTLAETHDGASVGVILSGTGTDGAQGIGFVRAAGGMTIVQDPADAEFDGMPRNAIDTGFVDEVLPIEAMVQRIREFASTRPDVAKTAVRRELAQADAETNEALQSALTLVRLRTGHDFLRYKPSTVARRVARRMQVLNLARVDEYVERLRADEFEATALLNDLLINVTSFFRDAAVFNALETQVIPELFEGRGRADAVRVWSVGCATGEEAYSLGMLLLEEADRHPNAPQLQIFATDLHERSLEKGREALFSEAIESEISPERIDRFFRRESGGYRVAKPLRDIVVFATHNLLRDPPFSRLDLVVCRNVLIYLKRDVQDEVIDLFHYALRPGGRLLLGTAETVDRQELFRLDSKEAHLYRRRDVPRGAARLPTLALAAPLAQPRPAAPDAAGPAHHAELSYAAVHQRMVEKYAAPSLLVGPGHEVVHLSDRVGRFLRHPGGEPTNDLFKLVRDEFRMELRTAVHVVRERHTARQSRPIDATLDGGERTVTVRASPATEPELEGFVLVVFDDSERSLAASPAEPAPADETIRGLEAELESTRARMQALIEEFETSQEEMRAANEELQSANEELRSTLEELETSREELQSVNEELQTLNQENRHKVEELSQLSSDLQNLLQSTDIATIFLDRNLRILRYTPRVTELFNVPSSDRGRPLADLTHRLGYPTLIEDARRVLQTLVPLEHEVETTGPAANYLLRIAPYRTVEDRIEGVVITMVDVTALKRTQAALARAEERQALLVRLHDATRPLGDPREVERVATRLLAEHLNVSSVRYTSDDQRMLLPEGHHWSADQLSLIREFGERTALAINRARAEETLRANEERYRMIVEGARDYAILTTDTDGRISSWSPGAEAVLGWTAEEAVGSMIDMTFTPEDRAAGTPERERAQAHETGAAPDVRWHMRSNGSRVFIEGVARALTDANGRVVGILKIGQDVTPRREMEESLRDLNQSLEDRVAARRSELAEANRAAREVERAFQRRLVRAEEAERKRLARDLHDEAGQLLTALGLGLQAVAGEVAAGSEVAERVAKLRALTDTLGRELHAVAVRLRPKALDDFGLEAALSAYADEWSRVSGIAVAIHAPAESMRLSESIETAVYRIVQEALTNVARHSAAKHVSVVVERRERQLVAIIEDDGRGFDAKMLDDPPPTTRAGLRGIRERVTLVGGTVDIESASGAGTSIFVRIPTDDVDADLETAEDD